MIIWYINYFDKFVVQDWLEFDFVAQFHEFICYINYFVNFL